MSSPVRVNAAPVSLVEGEQAARAGRRIKSARTRVEHECAFTVPLAGNLGHGRGFDPQRQKGRDDEATNPSGIDVRWGLLSLTALLCACVDKSDPPRAVAGADPDNGLALMQQVGCASCHAIPGVRWPQGLAGPSLRGFAESPMIGGQFPNRPDVLIAWLIDAPSMAPATAMPAMPLTEREARDVAAYLYTLDD